MRLLYPGDCVKLGLQILEVGEGLGMRLKNRNTGLVQFIVRELSDTH